MVKANAALSEQALRLQRLTREKITTVEAYKTYKAMTVEERRENIDAIKQVWSIPTVNFWNHTLKNQDIEDVYLNKGMAFAYALSQLLRSAPDEIPGLAAQIMKGELDSTGTVAAVREINRRIKKTRRR